MMKEYFKELKNGFDSFSQVFSLPIVSFILLLIYIFGVGISKVFFRKQESRTKKNSYWIDEEIGIEPVENYLKQY